MKIVIDIESAFDNPTGIGRITREFLKRLATLDAENEYWLFHSSQYSSSELDLLDNRPANWNVLKLPVRRRTLRLAAMAGFLPPGVKAKFPEKIDVAYFPGGYSLPVPAKRTAGLIYDLSIIDMPETAGLVERIVTRLGYRDLVRRAHSMITISEYSRRRMIEHWNLPADRVISIPLGVSASDWTHIPDQDNDRYFVWAGAMVPRKNIPVLIKAFALAAERIPDVQLVLIGPDGSDSEKVRNLVVESGLSNRVEFAGFLSDSELTNRMSGALAFVFPSIYEGFGLPIIESMSLGIPVITANSTSTAEVGGDSALLVDPTNPNELADAMVRVAGDPELRARMSETGHVIANRHTWDNFAGGVVKVLTEN